MATTGPQRLILAAAGYRNPLRGVTGLSAGRIDMGVDYGGSGPVYALGPGVITNLYNAGWPGGVFISERLTTGPFAGNYTYVAEDITPAVTVGQQVTAGTVIGHMFSGASGIETGWAAPPGVGETMAALKGQQATHGDPGAHSTAYGVAYSELLAALGAPAGQVNPPVVGTVPPGFGSGLGPSPTASGGTGWGGLALAVLAGLGIGAGAIALVLGLAAAAGISAVWLASRAARETM